MPRDIALKLPILLDRSRVFTLRCVVGEVAEVSPRARELAERLEARLTAVGSNQVRADALAIFGPRPSFAPLTHGET